MHTFREFLQSVDATNLTEAPSVDEWPEMTAARETVERLEQKFHEAQARSRQLCAPCDQQRKIETETYNALTQAKLTLATIVKQAGLRITPGATRYRQLPQSHLRLAVMSPTRYRLGPPRDPAIEVGYDPVVKAWRWYGVTSYKNLHKVAGRWHQDKEAAIQELDHLLAHVGSVGDLAQLAATRR